MVTVRLRRGQQREHRVVSLALQQVSQHAENSRSIPVVVGAFEESVAKPESCCSRK